MSTMAAAARTGTLAHTRGPTEQVGCSSSVSTPSAISHPFVAREIPEADDESLACEIVIDVANKADIDLHEIRPQRHDLAEVGDTRAGLFTGESDVLPSNATAARTAA